MHNWSHNKRKLVLNCNIICGVLYSKKDTLRQYNVNQLGQNKGISVTCDLYRFYLHKIMFSQLSNCFTLLAGSRLKTWNCGVKRSDRLIWFWKYVFGTLLFCLHNLKSLFSHFVRKNYLFNFLTGPKEALVKGKTTRDSHYLLWV